jgi:hypothetical protein
MLARIEGRSHELGIAPDGTIMPASRSEQLVIYHPK